MGLKTSVFQPWLGGTSGFHELLPKVPPKQTRNYLGRNSQPQFCAIVAIPLFHRFITKKWQTLGVTASIISCCGTLFNATFTVQDVWHKMHGLHEAAQPSSPKLLHTIHVYFGLTNEVQPSLSTRKERPHIRMEET